MKETDIYFFYQVLLIALEGNIDNNHYQSNISLKALRGINLYPILNIEAFGGYPLTAILQICKVLNLETSIINYNEYLEYTSNTTNKYFKNIVFVASTSVIINNILLLNGKKYIIDHAVFKASNNIVSSSHVFACGFCNTQPILFDSIDNYIYELDWTVGMTVSGYKKLEFVYLCFIEEQYGILMENNYNFNDMNSYLSKIKPQNGGRKINRSARRK